MISASVMKELKAISTDISNAVSSSKFKDNVSLRKNSMTLEQQLIPIGQFLLVNGTTIPVIPPLLPSRQTT